MYCVYYLFKYKKIIRFIKYATIVISCFFFLTIMSLLLLVTVGMRQKAVGEEDYPPYFTYNSSE